MKILVVTTISNTVNLFLIPHLKFLIEKGHEVGLAFKTEFIDEEIFDLGCKIHHVEFQRNPLKRENLSAYKQIKKIIDEEGYELVHVHTPIASFITRFACRKKKNVKVLYTAHGFHFFKGAPKKNWILYYPLEKAAARWTDGIITMNEEDYEAAKKFKLRTDNGVFKVNGVGLRLEKFFCPGKEEKRKLRKQYGYGENDFILLNVGEFHQEKQQDLLIRAVARIKGEIPRLKVLFAGSGRKGKDYRQLARDLGVEEMVEFLGYREDIPELMAISDLAVSVSRREGLPVNVMEAMAAGLPLIVTDVRGNRDLVNHGKNGLVIDRDNDGECAEAILKLYRSSGLREAFSAENRRRIASYSVESVLGELKEIYVKEW